MAQAPGALSGVAFGGSPQQLEARMRKRLLGDRQDRPFTLKARAWCVRGKFPSPEDMWVHAPALARKSRHKGTRRVAS